MSKLKIKPKLNKTSDWEIISDDIPIAQNGKQIQDQNGYLTSNLHNFTPKKIITGKKGTNITTQGMAFPIMANGRYLEPNTGNYYFPENKVEETPMFQNGGTLPKKYEWSTNEAPVQKNGVTVSNYHSATTDTGAKKLSTKELIDTQKHLEELKTIKDNEELKNRGIRIKQSIDAQGQPLTSKNLAIQTQATGDKLRFFPNSPSSSNLGMIDEYANPFKMVGDMASGLGASTYNREQGNYGQYAMAFAAPLITGAVGGIGAKSAGEFANNMVNPFAGTGELIDHLGNKYLPNAYKLNPNAFKPNSEMGYRMLGESGYKDALETGVLRAKQVPNSEITEGINLSRNTNRNPNTGKMQPLLDRPYFADGTIDERYASDYMAAVNKTENNLVSIPTHKGIAPSTPTNIPIENAQFYKKDWLKGYKQIEVPKSNFKSEIDWSKWNKEIPENKALMQNYSFSNTAKNLEDLKYAQEFANKYGYELPQNLERISQSDELTNRTIRGIMDRHNTFVRGVSTNWDELAKRNPEILRHLEGKGFNLSTKEGTKQAAEYMATHIPINTGYGRASLNSEVFDKGLEGLYTSNSIPTAEGYTYGKGFVVKVKKPTNYSSINRQDWINNNNPYYRDEDKFRELIYPLSDETNYAIHSSKSKGWIPKSSDEKLLKNATPKQKAIKEVEYRIEQLKKDITEIEPNKDKWVDASEVLYSKKETIKQLENDIKYLEQHGDEILQAPGEFKLLRTERAKPVDYNNPFSFQSKLNEFIESKGKNPMSSSKGTDEGERLYQDIINLQKNNLTDNKHVLDYLQNNHPEFFEQNKYAHYIHLGKPGEKVLQPIKSWEITPEIWKNKSRAHTNKYTKKFSALQNGGTIGNNGMFDMTNPNIYKALVPTVIAGSVGLQQKQNGGFIDKFQSGGRLPIIGTQQQEIGKKDYFDKTTGKKLKLGGKIESDWEIISK